MAEIVVSALVGVLIEKLVSGALMNFARSEGIESQLKKWQTTLSMIEAVLADSGQKQIKQRAVELWLIQLQELAYDIEDVLDDIETEVMKRKFEESQASTSSSSSKLLMIFPSCCTNFASHKMMYGRKMSHKLDEIMTRLNDLVDQKNSLSLDVNVEKSSRTNKPLEETSLVDESEILGREEDKKALLEKLLGSEASNDQNVKIVSIVGLGGVGKTTLARLLYNDEQVNTHFDVRAWVCVSNDFDVFNVSKAIYQALCGENKEFANLDLLHVALKGKVSNKRFLLVLDDVWNEDHKKWEILKRPLVGAPGSKVIVTTRNTMVASVMNSIQPYNLGVLSDEMALSLFAHYALEEPNFDKHPSLKLIAQGIVNKCDGLPLALVTLGRVLKSKGSDDVEWEELLNNEIWSSHGESDIQKALKLSYYHLPSHLKQVFAYCSLYPKDHQFDKNKIVLKWMAQGFLSQPKGNNQPMESLGCKYFEELQSRSFFQPLGSRYIMHDLLNDLATSVAGEFFYRWDDEVDTFQDEAYENFRHFSFVYQHDDEFNKKLKELHRARCLRTFLSVSDRSDRFGWRGNTFNDVIAELLPKLHFMRVLSVTNRRIDEVPLSISNLKHLRYLNFSGTDIQQIPEEVSKLYNLQSLLVSGCSKLSSLPVSFAKLINLRHLDVINTPLLKKMPLGIGGLTSLRTLSKVIIEGHNGFKVSELKGLSDLQGALSIEGLDKVIEPIEAKDANLQQKKGLDALQLVWSEFWDYSRDPVTEYQVLEQLRAPHCNLKRLWITGYGGMKFPSWFGDPSFDDLTELVLMDCENCTELATLGNLSSLEKLEVWSCPKLASMKGGEKEVGSSIMGSLRHVRLHDCDSLESYCCPNSVESLEIRNCSSMTSLSFAKLQDEEDLPSSSSSSSSSSSLKVLEVRSCKNLRSIGEKEVVNVGSTLMGSFRQVIISYCDSLESYCCPNSVESLEIGNCDSMTSLRFAKWQEDLPSSSLSSSFKILKVRFCKNLRSIGEEEVVNVRGSFRQVNISYCDSLESFFCPNGVESLEIKKCDSLTSVNLSKVQKEEDLPSSSSSSSNLKILDVKHCRQKEVVNVGSSIMPSLTQVKIQHCDSLESYCCPNSVESLWISKCDSMTSLSFSKLQVEDRSSSSSSNLKCLWINNCKKIKTISEGHFQSLTSLEVMGIYECPNMEDSFPSSGRLRGLQNLRTLGIGVIKKPMSEWGLLNYPPSVVELTLYGKNSGVVSFGVREQEEDHVMNNNTTCFLLPPSLKKLEIWNFEEVESVSEVIQHLPHLRQLTITRCPKLRDVPESTSSLKVNVD